MAGEKALTDDEVIGYAPRRGGRKPAIAKAIAGAADPPPPPKVSAREQFLKCHAILADIPREWFVALAGLMKASHWFAAHTEDSVPPAKWHANILSQKRHNENAYMAYIATSWAIATYAQLLGDESIPEAERRERRESWVVDPAVDNGRTWWLTYMPCPHEMLAVASNATAWSWWPSEYGDLPDHADCDNIPDRVDEDWVLNGKWGFWGVDRPTLG